MPAIDGMHPVFDNARSVPFPYLPITPTRPPTHALRVQAALALYINVPNRNSAVDKLKQRMGAIERQADVIMKKRR